MTSSWSVENQASRLPDSIDKLRYLREAAEMGFRQPARPQPWQLALLAFVALTLLSPPPSRRPAPVVVAAPVPTVAPKPVFLVEHQESADVYSNGLRILSDFGTTGAPRVYRKFDRATMQLSATQNLPAGIVFHTTESLVLPIEAGEAGALNRTRVDLLAHVRRDRLYNFVIDRLGQVYRVVPEDRIANHAGNSVWADSKNIFIDLNDSFLGVAFELRAGEEATAAQRHSGRLLTELLRSVYRIADGNCVTHAQVSVNPGNFGLGYHTDWGSGFPFEEVGLAMGYRSHVAAVEVFGFGYDEHLLAALGGRPWEGLLAAEQQILIDAAAHGILGPRYRTTLQQQFQTLRRRKHEKD